MARAIAVVFLVLMGCSPAASKAPTPRPAEGRVLLLATADVGSDTDVCGCKVKKLGGLTRRSAEIQKRKEGFDGPTLVVDAGDVFFRRWSIPPRYEAQARRTAALHADALAAWKAPAIAVGERDLALGIGELRRLARRANVKLLSANLVFTDSGTVAFTPYTVVDAGGLKVGLVGASPMLTPDDSAHQVYAQAGLSAVPEGPAVFQAARAARAAGAQWVVGLLHVGQLRGRALLDGLPAETLDLAIIGHDRVADTLRMVQKGQRGYVQAGERGKWLVAVEAKVVPGATRSVDLEQSEAHRRTLAELDAQIEQAVDPKRKARLERRRARMRTVRGPNPQGAHQLRVELVELSENAPEDPAMLARYRRYQADLSALADVKVEDADVTYVGHRRCRQCHAPAYKHWEKTGHAFAWATMEETRQTGNLDCIGCHVTGFERPGGPRRLADLKPFRNVGCESCHGPASAHVADPTQPLDYGAAVPERVCAECHRAQADQKPFDYRERLLKVIGPGHGAPTGGRAATRRP